MAGYFDTSTCSDRNIKRARFQKPTKKYDKILYIYTLCKKDNLDIKKNQKQILCEISKKIGYHTEELLYSLLEDHVKIRENLQKYNIIVN